MKVERDLLPIKAVKCDLQGHLVDFYRSCVGEGKKNPCGYYLGNYKCGYVIARHHPAFNAGRDTVRARVRLESPDNVLPLGSI